MAYDEVLAERVCDVLGEPDGLTTRKMFGGLAYMIHGNMACGVLDEVVVLRLGNEGAEKALKEPFMTPMDFTGKPMKSMVYLNESVRR
jgi:TfoX/Sxy family transcriptional regulator of competence genes